MKNQIAMSHGTIREWRRVVSLPSLDDDRPEGFQPSVGTTPHGDALTHHHTA